MAPARPALAPTAHPILSDLPVRRAIAYCTDKDALIAAAYPALTPAQRAALVMDSPILPTSWAYSPPATTYPYNPATGRALLDAAGWTLAPGAEYRTKGGKELYLTIIATDGAMRQAFLAVFEAQMRNCGVHVIRYHRNATWVYGAGGLFGRNFELGEFAWVGVEAPDLLNLYGCDRVPSPANNWSGNNYMGWCNPAADAAATQANNTALTQAERKAFYATFTNLFAADLPSLLLFRRDGSDTWEHIDFNLETYAQEKAVGRPAPGRRRWRTATMTICPPRSPSRPARSPSRLTCVSPRWSRAATRRRAGRPSSRPSGWMRCKGACRRNAMTWPGRSPSR